MKVCFLCGRNGSVDPLDKHHILGGTNRDKSEKDGLYVYLCHHDCHIFGSKAAHRNAETMQMLHEYGEMLWLSKSPGRTVEDFIARYGKNYLPLEYAAAVPAVSGSFEIIKEGELPF